MQIQSCAGHSELEVRSHGCLSSIPVFAGAYPEEPQETACAAVEAHTGCNARHHHRHTDPEQSDGAACPGRLRLQGALKEGYLHFEVRHACRAPLCVVSHGGTPGTPIYRCSC